MNIQIRFQSLRNQKQFFKYARNEIKKNSKIQMAVLRAVPRFIIFMDISILLIPQLIYQDNTEM